MNTAPDRRPIAARGWAPSVSAASWLVARRASANAISVAGMVAGLLAGTCFAATVSCLPGGLAERALWLAGGVLVQLRLVANMLDGMVALGRGIASPVGELFNELPDRVSDSAVLAGLGLGAGWPALGLAAALMAMATAYVRAVGKGAGVPGAFGGPMAKQQRMALVTVLAAAHAVLPAAWLGGWATRTVLWVVVAGAGLTAVRRLRTVARGLRRGAGP